MSLIARPVETPPGTTASEPLAERLGGASTLAIAFSAGVASLAMSFWIPFLPLYVRDLGASSGANALFWVGIATTGQGLARLVSGPFWGVLSDRVGRKLMFVRALTFATVTTLIAAFATEPWHVAVAFSCQGFFSGFIPAAVALTSVTVPDSKLNSSLGMVTGAQYIGNTAGPAIGSGLALAFGLRGAIFAAGLLPAASALLVVFTVPRDQVERAAPASGPAAKARAPRMRDLLVAQFALALFLYFLLFAINQVVRLATPIALEDMEGHGARGLTGVAFSLAGVASVVGVLVIARRFVRPGRFRVALLLGCLLAGLAQLLLGLANAPALYIAAFTAASLVQAAMLPATNTLIAANAPRARRGTAFGFAGSAQALAFIAGPMSAAVFAAISLELGFAILGGVFFALGLLLWTALREPTLGSAES